MSEHLIECYRDSIHWDLDGCTLEDGIKTLQERVTSIKEACPEAVEIRLSYEPEPYEDSYLLYLIAKRPENDKETAARVKREKEAEAQREAYRRRQYEALAKEFKDK